MKKSELLRAAKELLSRTYTDRSGLKRQPYICIAVIVAAGNTNFFTPVMGIREAIQADVTERIGGHSTIYKFFEVQGLQYTLDEVQQKRHELVDQLIAEYEAKGE